MACGVVRRKPKRDVTLWPQPKKAPNAQEQHRTHSGQLACGGTRPLLRKEGLTKQQQQQWNSRPRGPKNPLNRGHRDDRYVCAMGGKSMGPFSGSEIVIGTRNQKTIFEV